MTVLGVVALSLFNTNLKRGPKTWVVQPGETLTLSADEVHPDDEVICPGERAASSEHRTQNTESVARAGSQSRLKTTAP